MKTLSRSSLSLSVSLYLSLSLLPVHSSAHLSDGEANLCFCTRQLTLSSVRESNEPFPQYWCPRDRQAEEARHISSDGSTADSKVRRATAQLSPGWAAFGRASNLKDVYDLPAQRPAVDYITMKPDMYFTDTMHEGLWNSCELTDFKMPLQSPHTHTHSQCFVFQSKKKKFFQNFLPCRSSSRTNLEQHEGE